MIKRAEQMLTELRQSMRGGDGQVEVTYLFKPGEYLGNARLIARLTLGPGCSIGYHDHQNEEEIFYCVSGEGLLSEDGGLTEQSLFPGDAAITLAGQGHTIRNGSDDPLVLVAIILLSP